jgi:acylphosphatase
MDALGGSPVARRLVVIGRVQGVGFRWFVRETAEALGVSGWVRNMPDGTVVCEVAGPAEVVERFTAELRAGPPAAHVIEIRVLERDGSEPLPERFRVVR